MIAMAVALNPKVLIADEPTTALDVTVQAQIIDLMRRLQAEFGTAIILITHDLGLVAEIAEDVLVMYAGRAMERADRRTLFYRPHHPYTRGLLASLPAKGATGERLTPIAGLPPSLIRLPGGCPFHPRCPEVLRALRDGRAAVAGARTGPLVGVLAAGSARRPGVNRAAGARDEVLLRAEGVVKHFSTGRREELARRAGRRRRQPRGAARRDARPRGRDGLRQVDARPLPDPPLRADCGPRRVRRRRPHDALAPRAAALSPAPPGDLPGSLRLAQPAAPRRLDHRRSVRDPRRRGRQGAATRRCRS